MFTNQVRVFRGKLRLNSGFLPSFSQNPSFGPLIHIKASSRIDPTNPPTSARDSDSYLWPRPAPPPETSIQEEAGVFRPLNTPHPNQAPSGAAPNWTVNLALDWGRLTGKSDMIGKMGVMSGLPTIRSEHVASLRGPLRSSRYSRTRSF